MAQAGFTPIQHYRTTTASTLPIAGNLAAGELAINTTDEKLYFKNTSGVVKLLASTASSTATVSSVDVSGGTTGLTTSGGPITTSGTITLAGTLAAANGGTGYGLYAVGDVVYANTTTTLAKLTIGGSTAIMTSSGSAPQWSAASGVSVGSATTATNLAGGAQWRVPYQTGVGTTGFLLAPVTAGNAIIWDGSSVTWGAGPASSSASNLAGGGAYTVVYQSSAGTTAYATNGTTGQAFIAATGAAPSWGVLGAAGGGTGITAPGALGNLLTSNGAGAWTSTAPAATGPSTAKTYYMAQF